MGVKPNRIDLLTAISGVSVEEAWATRWETELDGIATRFIGRAALLRNKECTGRARDLVLRTARKGEVYPVSSISRRRRICL